MRHGALGIILGSLFICPFLYCVYFDYKRRHDAVFRRSLRKNKREHDRTEYRTRQQHYKTLLDDRIRTIVGLHGQHNTADAIILNLTAGERNGKKGDYEMAALDYYSALYMYSSPEELLPSICLDSNVRPILNQLIKLHPFDIQIE
ncbi:hypothetical protein V1514DRAFT_28108 [Lipomyces japonicus]|uniref:uncharacterized protein n=1 Tax=Lipomyces japonicus TaxID=56871 RepID=UPI0034CDE087